MAFGISTDISNENSLKERKKETTKFSEESVKATSNKST